MENHAQQPVETYCVLIHKQYSELLGWIRTWQNVKVALDGTDVWLKNFTAKQMEQKEILSIPGVTRYVEEGQHLFLMDNSVPERRSPIGLLWVPIDKLLNPEISGFNHNYFGITQGIILQVKTSANLNEPNAQVISINVLEKYIETAPAFRLNKLQWCIAGSEAILIGYPLLPLPGMSFYKQDNLYIQTGFELEYPELSMHIKTEQEECIFTFVYADNSVTRIPESKFKPLNTGSFRKTKKKLLQ